MQKLLAMTLFYVACSLSSFSAIPYWSQLGADQDGSAVGDLLGFSVALSSDGSVMAVGAPAVDSNGPSSGNGYVRVLQYTNNTWSQLGADIFGEANGDWSGVRVALSSNGSIVAVGAIESSDSGIRSGHVRVHKYENGIWSQLGSDIDGAASGDASGYGISLSADGTIIAIGAPYNDGGGTSSGHVRVFKYANETWNQLGSDIIGEAAGDLSGWSMSLSADGTILAVGARDNDGNGTLSGHVRVYKYVYGIWFQLGPDIDGEATGDMSGWSVSLSADGTVLAIGAPRNDGDNGVDSGHVRVYRYDEWWSQLGSDIDGAAAADQSGRSVSLSADGTVLIVGTYFNEGKIRAYKFSNGSWNQLGQDIDGETSYDSFAYSTSLSADGTTIAAGAIYNAGNGSHSGHGRAFSLMYAADSDNDGLIDDYELYTSFTDPFDPDSDSDGLSDWEEVKVHSSNPNSSDSDGDGFDDAFEVEFVGTNSLFFNINEGSTSSYSTLTNLIAYLPEIRGLTVEEALQCLVDLRAGSFAMEVTNNQMIVRVPIETTTNLASGVWQMTTNTLETIVPAEGETRFFRFGF